jgi:hypothetical protein
VLSPWNALVRQSEPGVETWFFMDDRAMRGGEADTASEAVFGDGESDRAGESHAQQPQEQRQQCSRQPLESALATTSLFDAALGLEENVKKRQHWSEGEIVEHLGLRLQGLPGQFAFILPQLRDGWVRPSTPSAD